LLFLLNLICGYVQISVHSPYIERFFNLLSKRGISFWGHEYIESYEISLFIRARDFKKLHDIARKTQARIKILKKFGLPFFTMKFKKRLALLIGSFVFITIIWVLTSFIWIIDVSGGDITLHSDIRKQLLYNGLKIGAYSHSINHDELKNDILLNFPELSNITVNITGSHAYVNIYMKTPIPEIIDYSTPSNIISDYDGIIKSITVTSGTPEVSPGDTIMRGQLLAGGYMTGRSGGTVEFRSIADIRARTWEKHEIIIPAKTSKKEHTGVSKKKYALILGKNRINLYFGTGNSYTSCDKIIEKVQLTLPFGLKLPIFLECCTVNEYISEEYTPSAEAVKNYLTQYADKYIELGEDDKITHRQFKLTQDSGKFVLDYTAECERKIGVEQMIPKGE